MKKRTHTHTHTLIWNFFFTLVLWELLQNRVHEKSHFFSFLLRPHKILPLSLSLSLSLFFIIASQKEARAPSRGREREEEQGRNARREFTARSAFSSRAFFLFFICRDIVCIFFYRKNKTKEQKPSDRRERKKGGGEVLEEFFFGSGWGGWRTTRKKEKKQKKKKYRKKTFINFAPITGTLGRKRKKECKERESEESTSEWCVKFRFSSARCWVLLRWNSELFFLLFWRRGPRELLLFAPPSPACGFVFCVSSKKKNETRTPDAAFFWKERKFFFFPFFAFAFPIELAAFRPRNRHP